MRSARRISALPPYLFAELDKKVSAARAKGVDVISFGIGDPDRPTPAHIVEAGQKAMADPATHQYPSYYGMPELREAIARYYDRRFGVTLDPKTQVLPLIGSKEGIAHLGTAFVDPGDMVLIQDPGYPVYQTATMLAGGGTISVPLSAEHDFVPQLDSIPELAVQASKVLWLNFPSNPTSAVCTPEFMAEAERFCARNDLLLAHDAAYVELTYDGYVAPSVLQAPGALDTAVEFGSLSKTYNMTGWRIGWAVGSGGGRRSHRPGEDQHRLGHLQRPPAGGNRRPGRSAGLHRGEHRGLQAPPRRGRRRPERRRNPDEGAQGSHLCLGPGPRGAHLSELLPAAVGRCGRGRGSRLRIRRPTARASSGSPLRWQMTVSTKAWNGFSRP